MTAPITTPAREQEAQGVDAAFQAALLALGVETIEDALALWDDVPAGSSATVAMAWLNRAVALIFSHRAMSRDLAIAYYRLARALRTGRTIPDPRDPIPTQVSLQKLRFEFDQMVNEATRGNAAPESPVETPSTPTPTESTPEPQAGNEGDDKGGDDDVIPIEDIGVDYDELEDDLAEQAEEQTRDLLVKLGPVAQEKYASAIDTNKPAKDVDVERKDAHAKAGERQASAAEHTVLNGGRGTVFSLAERDSRVIGWVRASKTGTPCGFCAMLISRGVLLKGVDRMQQLYRSKAAAEGKTSSAESVINGDAKSGDLYHLRCKCYAVPVYSESQFVNDPKYDLNREYAVLWPKVTKGLSYPESFNAWRNFIDAQKRDDEQVQAA